MEAQTIGWIASMGQFLDACGQTTPG